MIKNICAYIFFIMGVLVGCYIVSMLFLFNAITLIQNDILWALQILFVLTMCGLYIYTAVKTLMHKTNYKTLLLLGSVLYLAPLFMIMYLPYALFLFISSFIVNTIYIISIIYEIKTLRQT